MTIRNRKYLRKCNHYTPPGWAKQTDAAGSATPPSAGPPTGPTDAPPTGPSDAPPCPASPSAARQAAEPPTIHKGYAYQPLSAAPVGTDQWRTVDDVLQWAIPTQVKNPQLQEDRGPGNNAGDPPPEQPEDDGLGI